MIRTIICSSMIPLVLLIWKEKNTSNKKAVVSFDPTTVAVTKERQRKQMMVEVHLQKPDGCVDQEDEEILEGMDVLVTIDAIKEVAKMLQRCYAWKEREASMWFGV